MSYSLDGSVLGWFTSYLHDRTQCVRCGSHTSTPTPVLYGVPQGSVLGPILFLLYTADLIRLVESHGLSPISMPMIPRFTVSDRPGETAQLTERVSACIAEVAAWMRSNRLQLNTSKTEIIWCSSERRQQQSPNTSLTVGADAVIPVNSVCNLGIYINSDLSMRIHISKTVSSCFSALRQIRSIRRSITRPVLRTLVSSLVHNKAGLWLCHTCWPPNHTTQQAAVSAKCCSETNFLSTEMRSYHSFAKRVALADGSPNE